MAFCPHCGSSVNPDSDFCGNCRGPLHILPLASSTYPVEGGAPANPAPPHQAATPSYAWPGGHGASGYPARVPLRRFRIPVIVLGTMVVTVVLCVVMLFVVVKASLDPFMRKGMAAAEMAAAIQSDAELEDMLNTLSGDLKGSMDERIDSKAKFIRAYAAEGNKVVLNECPDDFAAAYRRHLSAWTDFADVLASHPHVATDDEAFVYHVLTGENISDSEEQQDVAAWAHRAKDAQTKADQSMRDVMQQAKTSFNDLGPLWQGLLQSK